MDDRRRRLPGELTFGLMLLVVSLFALWQAWGISGLSGWSTPGTMPMLATAVMVVSALAFVLDAARRPGPETSPDDPIAGQFARVVAPRAVVGFTLLIIGYMLALEPLGFLPSSFVFLATSMYLLGSRRILFTLVVSAASLAVIYVIFQTAFTVVLPSGTLFR